MTTTIPYGHAELQRVYQRNFLVALLSAVILVAGALSAYRIAATLITQNDHVGTPIRVIDLTRWVPSIPHPTLPNIHIGSAARSSFGIPVPVPESEVNPDMTFGMPTDDPNTNGALMDSGDGTMKGEWLIDDPIPDAGAFIPRESEPMPIISPSPIYPELARRLMLQGTVWIKAYVDKEGQVRKAIVVKSDAEIFDQPSIEAVSKWSFRPALMNNRPVGVWVGIPFRFRLE